MMINDFQGIAGQARNDRGGERTIRASLARNDRELKALYSPAQRIALGNE
jgi:hypothetical protein